MKHQIVELDRQLFHLINGSNGNATFDYLFSALRQPLFLQIVYLLLAIFLIYKYKIAGLWLVVFAAMSAGLGDLISSHFFKPYFHRLRPCADPNFLHSVKLLVPCGGAYSFTSSHAATNFAVCGFLALAFQFRHKVWWLPCMLYAGLISFAQVYVGVHYPIDVFCGMLIGLLCAGICYTIFTHIKYVNKIGESR